MRKRFVQLPISVTLISIASSVKNTGSPGIGDRRLEVIGSTHGLKEIGRIHDLVSLLRAIFSISGKYFKKD